MNNADDRGAIDTHDLQVLHLMRRTRGKIGVTGLGWGDQRDREDGDIKSLRQTQGTRRASVMPLHRKVCRFIFECFSFNSLVRMDKSEPMCANYGHRIDHAAWKTGPAFCADCGVGITGLEQLRGSTPKQTNAN